MKQTCTLFEELFQLEISRTECRLDSDSSLTLLSVFKVLLSLSIRVEIIFLAIADSLSSTCTGRKGIIKGSGSCSMLLLLVFGNSTFCFTNTFVQSDSFGALKNVDTAAPSSIGSRLGAWAFKLERSAAILDSIVWEYCKSLYSKDIFLWR